jgi:hypothetical protein
MSRIKSLIAEADKLATLINIARLECRSLPDDATVRLVEVTNLLMDICAVGYIVGVTAQAGEFEEREEEDDGIQCYINGRPVTNKEFADSYR